MKNRIKAIPLLLAFVIVCVSIAIVATLFLIMNNIGIPANTEVKLRIEWNITEGKYLPINVSAGDILYGKNGTVQIKIEEIKVVKGGYKEKQKPLYTIIKDAKGIVLKGEDKVEVGMELHLVENPKELITIPEASIPSIKVVKVKIYR